MTKAEYKLNDIWKYLAKRHGITAANRMTAPLAWYINTSRASVQFLWAFYDVKPFVIGRILAKHDFESYDEIIEAVKVCIMKGEKS